MFKCIVLRNYTVNFPFNTCTRITFILTGINRTIKIIYTLMATDGK